MNIALVDDDSKVLEELKGLIEEFKKEKGNNATVCSFSDPYEMLESKNSYSLMFLDIEMPGINGIELGKKIREQSKDAVIVYVTNMAQYALEGYSVNAYDYILKPIKKNVFKEKLEKFIAEAEKKKDETITILSKYNREVVKLSNIRYIEVKSHKLIYHLADREIESWGSISDLAESLKGKGFSLSSSSFLLNLSQVQKNLYRRGIVPTF